MIGSKVVYVLSKYEYSYWSIITLMNTSGIFRIFHTQLNKNVYRVCHLKCCHYLEDLIFFWFRVIFCCWRFWFIQINIYIHVSLNHFSYPSEDPPAAAQSSAECIGQVQKVACVLDQDPIAALNNDINIFFIQWI